MRTNIVLAEDLVREAMRLTGIRTKRAVVHRALETLIRLERQRGVLDLKGRIKWEGDLDQWRSARFLSDSEVEEH